MALLQSNRSSNIVKLLEVFTLDNSTVLDDSPILETRKLEGGFIFSNARVISFYNFIPSINAVAFWTAAPVYAFYDAFYHS